MATYTSRYVTTTRVEFRVPAPEPWGADLDEVMKAVAAADQSRKNRAELNCDERIANSPISVRPDDDAIVISYELRRVDGQS